LELKGVQPSAHKSTGAEGFTLIEVLVALIILSVSLTIIFSVFSAGLRAKREAENHQEATLLAESTLNAIGVEAPLQVGKFEGRLDDHFRWQAVVAPYHEEGEDEALGVLKPPLVPFVVTVRVSWGDPSDEQSVSLTTLRLATQ
jgi:general secretion pathway protein I